MHLKKISCYALNREVPFIALKKLPLKDTQYSFITMSTPHLTIHNFEALHIAEILLKRNPTPTTPSERIAHALVIFLQTQGHRFRASSIFKLKQPQIHYGIQPMYKTNPSYAQVFFERVPGFVGVTANTFQDSNKEFNPQLSEYIMLSVGSWNQGKRDYFPICEGSFRSMNETLRLERRPYKLRATDRITVFVQNYSPDEYWFGWGADTGIEKWLARERRFLALLIAHTSKRLYVKFHPKTAPEFKSAFKVEMAKSFSLLYSEDESLREICDASQCVVVNSGSSAIHACLLGAPLFYIDDELSNIPMRPFGINDLSKIDRLAPNDFPDQEMALDFVASQMCTIADFPSKAYISTLLYNESCC